MFLKIYKYLIDNRSSKSSCFTFNHNCVDLSSNNAKKNDIINDWLEIHDLATEYGTPELSDQLSGAMYMRTSIHEDKSSKAYRVSHLISSKCFNHQEMMSCLQQTQRWPLKSIQDSDGPEPFSCR